MGSLRIEGLGKRYVLDRPLADADTAPSLSGALAGVRRFFGRQRPEERASREFWALRDVSLDVQPGTILGVIGANGAGKSTLLKILARVTAPTEGRVAGEGRVVSLLELGAGFNPELSARENVFMNAAINGFSRAEAMASMDEIFSFAEMDQFIEQPLKHFSSGMYLRLAFSVAINMRPSILLADEILAVGDAAFQERCLQRVESAGREGLIVLFVSHDMEAIMRVCSQVLWLNKGTVAAIGEPDDVVADYQDAIWSNAEAGRFERGRQESRFAAIRAVKLVSADGREIGAAPVTEDVYVRIDLEVMKAVAVRGTVLFEARNQRLFRSEDTEFHEISEPGMHSLFARIPANLLADIHYSVTVTVNTRREGQVRQYTLVAYRALSFMAYATEAGPGLNAKGKMSKTALLAPRLDWKVEAISAARV